MARLSSIVKNDRRFAIASRLKEKRDALRKIIKSVTVSDEEKALAVVQLSKMPRDSSFCRYKNRCMFTGRCIAGRCRGVYRKFKLSRITFREMASRGEIPGVAKASW